MTAKTGLETKIEIQEKKGFHTIRYFHRILRKLFIQFPPKKGVDRIIFLIGVDGYLQINIILGQNFVPIKIFV